MYSSSSHSWNHGSLTCINMPHTLHIAHPPYTNTLNCRIVAKNLRLHWTSVNPHKHTLMLAESFLDSSYSKLRLTHSPAYPPLTPTLSLEELLLHHTHTSGILLKLFIHTQKSHLLTHLHTLGAGLLADARVLSHQKRTRTVFPENKDCID